MEESDLYAALIGDTPAKAQIPELAAALRRRSQLGQIGTMTGDPAMAEVGSGLTKGAQLQAAQMQQTRQAGNAQDNEMARAAASIGLGDRQIGQNDRDLEERRRNDNLVDARARDLAKIMADSRLDVAKEHQSAKDAQQVDKYTAQMSAKLNQSKIPNLEASMTTLNNSIQKYGDKLPGQGYLENALPESMIGDKGREIKQQVQAVTNDLLNMYSGLAVTDPEAARRAKELGTSINFGSKDFVRNWPNVVRKYNEIKRSVVGGYSPEVHDNYNLNMGGGWNGGPIMPADGSKPYVSSDKPHSSDAGTTPPSSAGGKTWGSAVVLSK